jgi:hypothetical protein
MSIGSSNGDKFMKKIPGVFFRKAANATFSLLLFAGIVRSQEWVRVDVSDPEHGKQYTQFTLQGKFLQAPHGLNEVFPEIILRCQPGHYSSGHLHGKFLAGVLYMGAIFDDSTGHSEIRDELFSSKSDPGDYYVEFKLDDGEINTEHWDNVLNYQGVGFQSKELNNILWGQTLPQKENTNPPIKKFLITIQRYHSGKIVMQFEMPNPAAVSELCGCTYFQKNK